MLTLTKLRGAEYLIASVAQGMEDYFMGAGEAPGVWRGSWAAKLGLDGVVTAEELRALVEGQHPGTGEDLLAGLRERKVKAIDVTLSVPKSVSVLWALGTPETSTAVSLAVVEATDTALRFLEERAAVTRVQEGGVRRRVGTDGLAVATFAHRTSRAGDPQLHTHCLIPNIVRRVDGRHVALDANPLHVWAKATGTMFLNQLGRELTARLGVAWGPERNGSRELIGFTPEQLRMFSKRTVAIEIHLEAQGELAFDSPAERMRADDRASLATRARKDPALTPEHLHARWHSEAATVGLHPGARVDDQVIGRQVAALSRPSEAEVFAALVDPDTGLCATNSAFGEAHVVERVAAMAAGRASVEEIVALSQAFLRSELVLRLAPDTARRRPPEWSTVKLRALEDHLLADLDRLVATPGAPVDPTVIDRAVQAEPKRLGRDQHDAVKVLCGEGPALRTLLAPAGHGKTTALHAAAAAQQATGRRVIAVAPTHKATAELRAAGLEAQTIARFLTQLQRGSLPAGTTVIVDEVSQLGTRYAAQLLAAVVRSPDAQLWCVGDVKQAQSVAAGGLAAHLQHLAEEGVVPAGVLRVNRRQHHSAERDALAKLRAGDVADSQTIRSIHGWEHQQERPELTRHALATAAVTDADRHGVEHVAVLAVSHADCEDLADRIRALRSQRGELRGPTLQGPGWGPEPRVYAAGDRVLLHANLGPEVGVFNGATGTILTITPDGATVLFDDQVQHHLPASVISGHRPDGPTNLSHAWARTVDGSQGGTWTQVHLLGTPTLDRFTGYVGQSRGQAPTHTWNTRPEADHPLSLLADQRDVSETVADALTRAEPKNFAATNDPWTLDRRLREERDEHAAIVATRPPRPLGELEAARRALAGATSEAGWAKEGLARAERRRGELGPLSRLRRGGRDDITRADDALKGAERRSQRANADVRDRHTTVHDLEAAVAHHGAWHQTHGWRIDRIAELDHQLDHHWAEVVLNAARADDPLAFGIDRLRRATHTQVQDLARITATLPPDRANALAKAEADLRHHRNNLTHAERNLSHAHTEVEAANQRSWGRRDKPAIARAERDLDVATTNLDLCTEAIADAHTRVEKQRAAVQARDAALEATSEARADLAGAVRDLNAALEHTRPQRIAAAANHEHPLQQTLGPPPETRGGLAAWCGIAERIETEHDRRAGTPERPATPGARLLARHDRAGDWDLTELIEHAQDLIHTASRLDPRPAAGIDLDERELWQPTLDHARPLAIPPPTHSLERDFGIEL